MYELRIYKMKEGQRIRIGKLSGQNSVGLIAWICLFFVLKHYKVEN